MPTYSVSMVKLFCSKTRGGVHGDDDYCGKLVTPMVVG